MANAREIKGRIRAVANIRRITKTMQMIATAQFQASQKRVVAAQPYTHKIGELVGELAGAAGDIKHPLLKGPDPAVGRDLVLVLASNRGLCGGYNANILRTLRTLVTEIEGEGKDAAVEAVGKKAARFCKFIGIELDENHEQFGDKPAFEEVNALAEHYMAEFTKGGYDSVKVVYMAFKTMSRQEPEILTLLPMQPPQTDDDEGEGEGSKVKVTADYDFSPDPETLLNELLPVTVKTRLFQCFIEAIVSENIARMVAMKAATDAAGKIGKGLTRQYNRARQTAITTELSEIIAGTAALE